MTHIYIKGDNNMKSKKTALIIAAALAMTTLASCGTNAPAATTTAASETTTAAAQTEAAATTEATTTVSEAPAAEETSAQTENNSGRVDIPESEIDAYMDKIFAANQREAVFKNHESLTVALDIGIDAGEYKADYNWFLKDVTYYSAPAFEELSFSDVRYEMVGIGSDYQPVSTYCLDMIEGGYQYWPTPTDKNKWYDTEHEKPTEVYIQDGKLIYNSVYDEEGSSNYFSVILPQVEYTGGKVLWHSVHDAETFELLETSSSLEKDGETIPLISEIYTYDSGSTPICVHVVTGAFERYSPNMMTVTATAHPGTDKEITKSINIPVNSMVQFYTPDMTNPEYFTDPECTKPYSEEWDMMSDLTVYIRDAGE